MKRWLRGLLVLTVLVLSGCPDPVAFEEGNVEDPDRTPPDPPALSESRVGDAYDTQPTWTWNSQDPVSGAGVFRFRLNNGPWITPDPPTATSYSVANDTDEDGNPGHLFPGTYVFEVQERNSAGDWSETAAVTTVILVREPVHVSGPEPLPATTENRNPTFTWQQWRDEDTETPQFGATNTFSWRLERRDTISDPWDQEPVAGETGTDMADVTEYTVQTTLGDGVYRFGVSELNEGGEESAYAWTEFAIGDLPCPALSITCPGIDADPPGDEDSGNDESGDDQTGDEEPEDEAESDSVAITLSFDDPADPTFTLSPPGTIVRGEEFTATLESTFPFDDVMWLVNGLVVDGVSADLPATEATLILTEFFTGGMDLGVNRITVLVEIDGNWYSSEDIIVEVVQS